MNTPEIIKEAARELRKNMTPEKEQEYRAVLAEAIQVGHRILKAGGSSQEAVEKTIHVMEESPLFNAGKGAVLNAEGSIELDASTPRRSDQLNAPQSMRKTISRYNTLQRYYAKYLEVLFLQEPHLIRAGLLLS